MKIFNLLLVVLFMSVGYQAEAQLLNKLKKKVGNTFEETVERKVGQETEKRTSQLWDKASNGLEMAIAGEGAQPAAQYHFDYEYELHYKNDKGNTHDFLYYLSLKEQILAAITSLDDTKSITLYDHNTTTVHLLLENRGDKLRKSMKINMKNTAEDIAETGDVKRKRLVETKNILGYKCTGYETNGKTLDGKSFTSTVWIYEGSVPNFSWGGSAVINPSDVFENADKQANGIVMEMDMTTYKIKRNGELKKLQNDYFICTRLELKSNIITPKKYKNMME